jgi:glyoxylase-like metal-dependent hydrolase (beta-lactamase superfamily II)
MRDLNGVYGANQIFIAFDDYVVVFDAGRVDQARLLDSEIRARFDKPVRFVVHSHFHPDHTAGAAVITGEDVEFLASAADRESFEGWAREDFANKVKKSPEQYRDLHYPAPTRYLEETEIFDDGRQRLEVIHYGHGHTKGDLVGWLPNHGILLVGDLCENRQYPTFANSNVKEWTEILDRLRSLPVKKVVPGHSHLGGPEMIETYHRFFVELQRQVSEMVARGMTFQQVLREVEVPFFEEWTGIAVRDVPMCVAVVYREAGGGFVFLVAFAIGMLFVLRKRRSKVHPNRSGD